MADHPPTPKIQTSTLHSSKERIKVFVRVRPLVEREIFQQGNQDFATTVDVLNKRVEVKARSGTSKCVVDGVFPPTTQQTEVYAMVKDCVMSVTEGFNATCFAYGQTGSGKTFTMFGDDRAGDIYSSNASVPATAGVIPRAVRDVLAYSRSKGDSCTCYVSFMQIYNEQVYDLLRDPTRTVSLTVKENSRLGVYVEGLSEFAVDNEHDVLRLLRVGDNRRAVRATRMNDMSSRSHSVFQMVLEQRRGEDQENKKGKGNTGNNKLAGKGVVRSKLNLVDLAGSEKWNVHHNIAQAHISELTNINLSLHTLSRCIEALSKTNHTYVPYRESKLTRLLQDSLGGSAKTRLFAMMSPSTLSAEEAQATLRFADCAKRVMQHVTIKETRQIDHVLVARLEREVQQLRAKLAAQPNAQPNGNGKLTIDTNMLSNTPSSPKAPSSSTSFTPPEHLSSSSSTTTSSSLSQQPPIIKVISSAQVLDQLEKYKKRCMALENTLEGIDQCANRFFRFEIEEEQMESEMKEHLHRSKSIRREKMTSLLPKGTHNVTYASEDGTAMRRSRSGSGLSRGQASPMVPRRSTNKTPTIGMKFRIRGAPTTTPNDISAIAKRSPMMPSTTASTSAKSVKSSAPLSSTSALASSSTWMTDEEKEGVLQARLKDANRKMAKQKKLQQWLAEKAKKEQAALDEHNELENARREAIKEAERRRTERNKENKAKLASWRQQQINELNSLLEGPLGDEDEQGFGDQEERPPPDW